jgi:hypothetical protein
LAAAARIRNDTETERKFSEIKLRACQRIGQISLKLERAKPNKGHGVLIDENTKKEMVNRISSS